jgi:hypothetical protein
MHPGGAGDELAQEQRRLDAVAGLVGGVEQVGHLRVEEAPVVLDQGQLAGQLAGPGGGGQDLGGEGRGVAEHAGAAEAEAVDHRPGQGGQVQDGVRLGLGGPGEPVGQDQTALGVGVGHLDGDAVAGGEDIAGPHRRGPGHVLDQGQDGRHGRRQLQARPRP